MIATNIGYEQNRLLNQVLTMHFIEEKKQSTIASTLGLSTAKVNRLIKQAKEQGLLEINIRTPFQNLFDLEKQIRESFGTRDAFIIPNSAVEEEAMYQTVGRAAANYLLQNLRDGDTICIASGKGVHSMIHALESRRSYDVQVVPASGSGFDSHFKDVNYLASHLADRLGGKAVELHAPYYVDTPKERDFLVSMRQIREVLDIARNAQIAVFGIGSVIPDTSSFFNMTKISGKDKENIVVKEKAHGDINGCFFNAQGEPCAIPYAKRKIGLNLEEIAKIPLSIGVSTTQEKVIPICAALNGNYLKTLVTDEETASDVLALKNKE